MVPATAIFGLRRARLSYNFTRTRATELGAGLTHADLSGAKLTADGGGLGDAPRRLSAATNLLTTMSHDLLSALPQELQLLIAEAVGDRCDRAALALASPRLLGLAACRELPSYQGLEMSLAFHHVLGGPIDEQSLRSYASRSEATLEGCEWLAWLAGVAAAGLLQSGTRPGRPGRDAPLPIPSLQIHVAVSGTVEKWFLLQPSSTFGALLRDVHLHVRTVHYEGEEGAERMVRSENLPSGQVIHYEGEKGVERVVRRELPNDGQVLHYEGERGAERMVRCERTGGTVSHFEGEKGAEREVRSERPSGQVFHFEDEKGAERLVRSVLPSGQVLHYEGERGAARMVRCEQPCGQVLHYEGEKGAERWVRIVFPSGHALYSSQVSHYEGKKGAERWVRSELPCGQVIHYEGEKGAERRVRIVFPSGHALYSGQVSHYEGEKGAERWVRCELPSRVGQWYEVGVARHFVRCGVLHYEGEKGAERKVRMRPSEYPAARWLTMRARRAWLFATELGVALRHRRRIAPNPR